MGVPEYTVTFDEQNQVAGYQLHLLESNLKLLSHPRNSITGPLLERSISWRLLCLHFPVSLGFKEKGSNLCLLGSIRYHVQDSCQDSLYSEGPPISTAFSPEIVVFENKSRTLTLGTTLLFSSDGLLEQTKEYGQNQNRQKDNFLIVDLSQGPGVYLTHFSKDSYSPFRRQYGE